MNEETLAHWGLSRQTQTISLAPVHKELQSAKTRLPTKKKTGTTYFFGDTVRYSRTDKQDIYPGVFLLSANITDNCNICFQISQLKVSKVSTRNELTITR